tara:strand:- start:416 stop:736 length:321 start_codon:yes stop_codon:yes gene_type:complete
MNVENKTNNRVRRNEEAAPTLHGRRGRDGRQKKRRRVLETWVCSGRRPGKNHAHKIEPVHAELQRATRITRHVPRRGARRIQFAGAPEEASSRRVRHENSGQPLSQ